MDMAKSAACSTLCRDWIWRDCDSLMSPSTERTRQRPAERRASWAYRVEQKRLPGIILGVDAVQLRLFPAPKPLVERLGVASSFSGVSPPRRAFT